MYNDNIMAREIQNLTPEKPAEDYIFYSIFPHPTDPITDETFEALDSTISSVLSGLGLAYESFEYPISHGSTESDASITVYRKLGPDGLKCIGGSIIDRTTTTSYNIRNDAGTYDKPQQNAGSARRTNNRLKILEMINNSVSNHEIDEFAAKISDRDEQKNFVAKKRVIFL